MGGPIASFELQGMAALQAALKASPGHALPVLGAALYREANAIMVDSKAEVPVKYGILRASGVVDLPHVSGAAVEVAMGYGGAAQSYAVMQHERTDFHHRVGKDHYLSDPLTAHAQGMQERLAADVAAANLFPGLP